MSKNDVGADKRTQILKAAVAVFSRHGFHQARVEEIAQEAGVGKGTVYEYFESKRHLFEEMVREGLKFYAHRVVELDPPGEAEQGETFTDKLRRVIRMHLEFFLEYRELAEVTMGDSNLVSQEMRGWMREMRREQIDTLRKRIELYQQKGEIRGGLDPEVAAVAMMGVLASLWHYVVWDKDRIDLDLLTEKVLQLMLGGLGVK